MKKLLLAVCLTGMMMFLMAPAVHADLYYLTQAGFNPGISPPYGTVELTQDGSDVDITVTLTSGLQFVRTGAGNSYNFLFNGTGVTLADLNVAANPGLTFGSDASQADGSGSGWDFGVFLTDQGPGGSDPYPGPLSFTVLNASLADLEIGNDSGNLFAADVISQFAAAGANTGLVWNGNPPQVPEPGTLLLLGSGLFGLGMLRRKFRG